MELKYVGFIISDYHYDKKVNQFCDQLKKTNIYDLLLDFDKNDEIDNNTIQRFYEAAENNSHGIDIHHSPLSFKCTEDIALSIKLIYPEIIISDSLNELNNTLIEKVGFITKI